MVGLPDQTAKTVAKATLQQWMSYFGVPDALHSDRGSCFEADLYKEFCRIFEIHKSRCTSYHPIANSSVEKTNLYLANALRAVVKRNRKDWCAYLPLITMVNNSMGNASTGFTPFRLVFGREMRLPIHLLLPPILRKERTANEWNIHLEQQLEMLQNLARTYIGNTQRRQKRLADMNAFEKRYKVGDFVYSIHTRVVKGRSKKLENRFDGPLLVVPGITSSGQTIRHPLYKVRNRRGKEDVIHHDRLILANDKVGVPFWLQRQRRDILTSFEDSVHAERKRMRREVAAADRGVPHITYKDSMSKPTRNPVPRNIEPLSPIPADPIDTGPAVSLTPTESHIESGVSEPILEEWNTAPNTDLDATIPYEGSIPTNLWPTEQMLPQPSTAQQPGRVLNPEKKLQTIQARRKAKERSDEIDLEFDDLFNDTEYKSRAGRVRKPIVKLDL